jgi:hypothetical protein
LDATTTSIEHGITPTTNQRSGFRAGCAWCELSTGSTKIELQAAGRDDAKRLARLLREASDEILRDLAKSGE